jgi:hypothetical protein
MASQAMREIECVCGEHLEGRNDTTMLEAFQRHCEQDHPEWTVAEIKAHFARNASDVPIGAR